jgi:fido (protein-threonine AMPylation protein)
MKPSGWPPTKKRPVEDRAGTCSSVKMDCSQCCPRSMIDPYIDPQSGVLRNRFGLADQQSLDRAEANAVSIR